MQDLNKKAVEILNSIDEKFYIDMTDPIATKMAEVVMAQDDGVLLLNNGIWMWTATNQKKALEIIDYLKKNREGRTVVSHTNICVDDCANAIKATWRQVPCYVGARFSKEPYQIVTDLTFKKLNYDYANFVWHTYNFFKNNPNGLAQAKESIDQGMVGAFLDDQIVGFIGIHEEGTMGMLEILPDFRQRGYGEALEEYLANDFIKQGRYPYCHILETNVASLALQRKMGLWLSEGKRVYWMG